MNRDIYADLNLIQATEIGSIIEDILGYDS